LIEYFYRKNKRGWRKVEECLHSKYHCVQVGIEQYRKILRLLINNGADKNSTSRFSKTNIKETYQNELIWQCIGDMWE
jgi:hypothetical protein